METRSKNSAVQSPASGESYTTRLLIDDPLRGWRIFSVKRFGPVFRGEQNLPEYAGQNLRFAEALLKYSVDAPATLIRLDCFELFMDSEGWANQDQIMNRMLERINGEKIEAPCPMVSEDDMNAIRRCLHIQDESP
jgi:hypothetical protein